MTAQKPDRRVQRTRQLLHEALISLILEKGYDRISVQDIVDRANVGRSTFYDHYQDKDDLLVSDLEVFHGQLGQGGTEAPAGDVLLSSLHVFQHAQDNYHLYKALLGGDGINLILRTSQKQLSDEVLNRLDERTGNGRVDIVPPDILANHLSSSLLSLLTWWLDHEMPYSPEKMEEIYQYLVKPGVDSILNGK
jgi:AcrR family transcriptional regulator